MFKNAIYGLDELFKDESDIPPGTVVLVTGAKGTLKSAFLLNMISNYLAGNGEHGLYATLEESEESLLRNMGSFGLKKLDSLHIFDYKDIRYEWKNEDLDIVKVTEDMIEFYKEKYDNLTVFAMDSLNALYSISSQTNLRKNMYRFFTMLRDKGFTSFLIMETYSADKQILVKSADFMNPPEFFLADGIIELGMIEAKENVKRYIQIRKMRGANHSMNKHQIILEKDCLHIFGLVY